MLLYLALNFIEAYVFEAPIGLVDILVSSSDKPLPEPVKIYLIVKFVELITINHRV